MMGWMDRIRGFFTTEEQAQPPAGTARNPWDNDDGVVNDVVASPGPAPMPNEEPVVTATSPLELDTPAPGSPSLFKKPAAPRKTTARKPAAPRKPRSPRKK
jgi:hypothetical protein